MIKSRIYIQMAGLLVLANALFNSGCALLPLSPQHAVSIPQDRLLSDEWRQEMPGSAHLTLSRDADFYRRDQCQDRISVDGKDQARIQPGERLDLYLPAGRHLAKIHPGAPCPGSAIRLEREFQAGQWLWYRIDATSVSGFMTLTAYNPVNASTVAPARPPTLWQRLRGRPTR